MYFKKNSFIFDVTKQTYGYKTKAKGTRKEDKEALK